VYGRDQLVVAVTEKAVDGRATQACLRAVARALGLRTADLTVVSGARHRTKVIAADLRDEAGVERVRAVLERLRDT
jgi:uncharacterized protein YggU (UPF0235/DUF167 family)